MASAFPTYTKTKWASASQESKIIVPCSNDTLPDDWRTDYPSANGWDTTASVSDGNITITRFFFFTIKSGVTVRPREIPPIEVFRAPGFPKRRSRLPEDRRFIYLGNGELSKIGTDIDSKLWVYRATYVLDASIDDDEDENTKPWNRKPWGVSLTHPEVQKPFLYGYDENNRRFKTIRYDSYYGEIQVPTDPVINSAGDRYELMRTKTNLQLNFTYALKPSRFNINDLMDCIHTINKSKIKMIGVEIPARRGYMEGLEPHYQVDDNGNEYWEINVSILLDRVGDGFQRHVYDVGNRARWHLGGYQYDSQTNKVVNANGVIVSYGSGALTPSSQAIYGWWPYDNIRGQFSPGKKFQIGNAQMLMQAKEQYDKVLNANKRFGEFVYETLSDIPLAPDGTVWFDAMDPSSPHYGQYHIKDFQEHPQRDWDSLDIPRNGVKW